ncbi:MAG: DNA primase [Clostridiales Family XIII bacterium]|nr:DNA primase [Clostridiales Family XIII bacterium]
MPKVSNIAEEIKDRADIVDYIGRVVKLRKRGVLWEGLCPFHVEKTPSFKVYDDSQHYHCYGCGASGDVISFYMKYHNLNFVEAATRLAEELHIDWAPGGRYESESRKKEYYAINREAALYYHQALREPDNPGYLYLAERGISKETMTSFGLGYAGGSRDGLCRRLVSKGIPLEKPAEMTLIVKEGREYRDRYYSRVMFPIMNVTGKVIGFSARTIDPREKEKQIAKYINSSESDIFHKKDHLYALNRTKDAISAAGRTAILVEGQIDVVSVWQHGVPNVTASLGTALTEQQARLLTRFADHVVLAYDMDESGRDAAVKAGEILRLAGLEVKVMSLPAGKDPDEFIRAKGREAFLKQVESAVPYLEYRLTRILEGYDLGEKEGTVAFLKEAADVLAGGMSPVERDYYVKWLERVTGISAYAIEEEAKARGALTDNTGFNPHIYVNGAETLGGSDEPGNSAWGDAAVKIQRRLIGLLVHTPEFLVDLRGREQQFTSPELARLFLAVTRIIEESVDGVPGPQDITALLEVEEAVALRGIISEVESTIGDDPAMELGNYLAQLDEAELKDRRSRVNRTLAELLAKDDYDRESASQLTLEIDKINENLLAIRERIKG